MKHVVKHDLEPHLARKAAEKALDAYCSRFARYDPTVEWGAEKADIRFKVRGVTLSGVVEIEENTYKLQLDVPLILGMFKKQALAVIEKEISDWVGKAKRGEL